MTCRALRDIDTRVRLALVVTDDTAHAARSLERELEIIDHLSRGQRRLLVLRILRPHPDRRSLRREPIEWEVTVLVRLLRGNPVAVALLEREPAPRSRGCRPGMDSPADARRLPLRVRVGD
jgi:hypothetical protein